MAQAIWAPSLAGNANLKRQCYFLTFTQFFLLPEPPLLSRVPTFRLLCRQIDPALPHLISPCSLTVSLCSVHTHLEHAGVCNCNCVFVQNNYAVSTFWSPFPVRLAKGRNILCVYSRQMLSEWLPCFHYTLDVLFCALHNMHTHCWETKVTLWIRFLSARRSRSLRWGVNIFSSALLKLLIIYAFSPFIFKTF